MRSDGPGLSSSKEKIVGEIPVIARLSIGAEQLRIFLTDFRLIVAHIGKRGTATLATTSLLGRLADAFEELFKGGAETFKRRRAGSPIPEGILGADKDNFFIPYDDVVRVELDPSPSRLNIMILTKDEKLSFVTPMAFDSVFGLLRGRLGERVSATRLTR